MSEKIGLTSQGTESPLTTPRIFDGPTVEKVDDRFDYGEVRVYAVGLVNGLEITVVYTDRDNDERRIISAWRSEPHERRYFWQNVEG